MPPAGGGLSGPVHRLVRWGKKRRAVTQMRHSPSPLVGYVSLLDAASGEESGGIRVLHAGEGSEGLI